MSSLYTPEEPKDIPLRPLSKGMRRDEAENALEVGEFYDLSNFLVRTQGLQRRRAFSSFLGGAAVAFPPLVALDTIWKTDGVACNSLLDGRMLYSAGASTFTLAKYVYAIGTVTCSVAGGVTHVAGAAGSLWATAASDVKIGDIFYCATLSGANKYGIIRQINSDTSMDLETNEGTVGAGAAYEIRRSIWGQVRRFPDRIVVRGKLLIADGRRRVRAYDPLSSATTYSYYNVTGSSGFDDYIPYALAFFKDRIFTGRTIESTTTDNRQRVRWTTTLDLTKLPALQFLDLPYTPGHIRRLMGLGEKLICYMSDGIYPGVQTNLYDALPVSFPQKLDTGGIGLVGDRALVSALGGHFFVGDDNVYFLQENGSLEGIADPIKDLLFSDEEKLWSVRMELDANNTRLLLTEPSGDLNYTKLFSFDYKSKAWSYEEFAGNFLGKKQITRGFTYDTWISAAPYDYDTGLGVFPDHTYDGMATTDSGNEIIYVGKGSSLFYYGGTTITSDAPSGTAISTRIESGDFDYGEPDRERKHLRLSLKLKTPLLQDLLFILRVSDDSGTTWRDVTAAGRPLRIPAGKRENYVNFRSRGSTFRFRLESSSVCGSYLIQEIVLRAIGAGVEGHLVSNR